MPRSLENLFDDAGKQGPKPPSEGGRDFDELLDKGPVDTKGTIDSSWDKVGKEAGRRASKAKPVQAATPESYGDDSVDDLLGMGEGAPEAPKSKPKTDPKAEPNASRRPEPGRPGSEQDESGEEPAGSTLLVVIGIVLLVLAGLAIPFLMG